MEVDRVDPDIAGGKKDAGNHGNPFPEVRTNLASLCKVVQVAVVGIPYHVLQESEEEWVTRLRQVKEILRGEKTVSLHQEFLIRSNHTDLQILKNTKVF